MEWLNNPRLRPWINSIIGCIVLLQNILEGIGKYSVIDWIVFTVPFVFIAPYLIVRIKIKNSLWIESIGFLLFAFLCIIFGDKGNSNGAWFFYMFCYSWGKEKVAIGWGIGAIVVIGAKFWIAGYTALELSKYLLGYCFVLYNSFHLTWNKKRVILKPEKMREAHRVVIELMLQDKNSEEIARDLNITTDAVNKRVLMLRQSLGCKTIAGMIEKLIREGILRL